MRFATPCLQVSYIMCKFVPQQRCCTTKNKKNGFCKPQNQSPMFTKETGKAILVIIIGIVVGGYAFTAMSKKSLNIWKA